MTNSRRIESNRTKTNVWCLDDDDQRFEDVKDSILDKQQSLFASIEKVLSNRSKNGAPPVAFFTHPTHATVAGIEQMDKKVMMEGEEWGWFNFRKLIQVWDLI
jgi:hypothetical protein